jgi:hypothetical protein
VRATSIEPTSPADWVNISLGSLTQDSYKALAEVNGVPAIVFAYSPALDTREIHYAYGNSPAPDDAGDFTMTLLTNTAPVGHYVNPTALLERENKAACVFWSSVAEQLCFARATSSVPTDPMDWVVSPLCSPACSGSRAALADWQDRPLVVHAGIGGDSLTCAQCADWQPESLLDWQHHCADAESTGLDRISVCELPTGVAAVYRDPDLGGWLICAWFSNGQPQGGGDWCVMPVAYDVGYGGQAVAALHNGLPAIVYGNETDSEIWLATMTAVW